MRVPAVLLLCSLLLSGCTTVVAGAAAPATVPDRDRDLVRAYVTASNAAADAGPDAQAAFLRDTQAPGVAVPPPGCLSGLRLRTRLVERTLRPDPEWAPPVPGGRRPDGAVYVVATAVTVTRVEGALVSESVGSKHFVVRDGRALGYAPCSR